MDTITMKVMNSTQEENIRHKSVATQTTVSSDTQTGNQMIRETQQEIESGESFLKKLKNFLLDIFQSDIIRESPKAQSLLIDGAMRNNFKLTQQNKEDDGENRQKTKQTSCEGAGIRIETGGSKTDNIGKCNIDSIRRDANNVENIDSDSLEEGIISVEEESCDDIWQTIEKKQIKVQKKPGQMKTLHQEANDSKGKRKSKRLNKQ